ncbi:MAG TPA: hypothetical protein VFG14_03810, partial [Chthoniobacteraceae bacterium]|nr:hypothetical protein [Chthoniobacteraceae bacterium]
RESEPTERRVVIVSDLQEGAALDRLQGYEWPKNTSVDVVTVGPARVNNVSVQWIPDSGESQEVTGEPQLRLRVANSAGNSREQFSIRWVNANSNSDSPPPIPAYAPAGQSRIVRLSRSPSKDANAIAIDGDEVSFDNTVHLVPPQPLRIPILFLGQESAADAQSLLYYLHRAFPKTGNQSVEIIAHGGDQPVPAFQVQDAQLALLGETPGASAIGAARAMAKSGRIVVMALTSVQSGAVLSNLLELPSIEVTEASVRDYALLGEINFQHPLFAPFADSRFSDFTKIHYWKHRQLDAAAIPGAQVIAKFDRGAPAVVQVPLGRGSVVVFTSSWRPVDGQLALSSKFVPLLHALLEQSSDIPVTKAQYVVGDSIPLHSTNANTTVRKPDGAAMPIAVGTTAFEADQPGIYEVTPGNRRYVVNLSPEESQLAPLPLDRFRALGVPLQAPVVDPTTLARRAAAAQAIDLENRQKAWRWLIAAALAVLLIEILIAGKLSGANRSSTVSTS